MELRDYQTEALNAAATFARAGGKRGLVALPTGTGKTFTFAQIPEHAKGRVLIIAHRDELILQTVETLEATGNTDIGVEKAERHSNGEKVVVASIQTLAARKNRRLKELDPTGFSCVIIDEAHHSAARSYIHLLEHFGLYPDTSPEEARAAELRAEINELDVLFNSELLTPWQYRTQAEPKREEVKALKVQLAQRTIDFKPDASAPLLLGWTATPARTDKVGLESVYDEIIYQRTIREMIEEGWLVNLSGLRCATDIDLSGVHTARGDYIEHELSEAVNTHERNEQIVNTYIREASGRHALCFCVDVKHTQDMMLAFAEANVRVGMVVGTTPLEERRATLTAFKAGQLDVLCNCMVLTEGFDAPAASCAIMARPTKSQLLYTQMIGRVTRIAPGKTDSLILDFVDVAATGAAAFHTLFGLGLSKIRVPDLILAIEDEERETSERQRRAPKIRQTSDVDPLAEITANIGEVLVWVKIPSGFASSFSKGQLGVVENLLGQWEAKIKVPGSAATRLGTCANAHEAALVGEQYAIDVDPDSVSMLGRNARWRVADVPPTGAQAKYAKSLGVKIPEGATKGQVSTLIDAAQHAEHDMSPMQWQLTQARMLGVELPPNASRWDVRVLLRDARRRG